MSSKSTGADPPRNAAWLTGGPHDAPVCGLEAAHERHAEHTRLLSRHIDQLWKPRLEAGFSHWPVWRARCALLGGDEALEFLEPVFKRGGSPGRPKGVPNKATTEVKEMARRLLNDPEYQGQLRERLIKGTLPPAVETMLWAYGYGKPKETLEVSVAREPIWILPPLPAKVEPELVKLEEPPKLPLAGGAGTSAESTGTD